MENLKAIETVYNGYRFRSRLEARWAVFFDTAGIKYEYEKEGFDLGDAGYYLPDFWLPELDMWVEVKGWAPSDEEVAKAQELAIQSKKIVAMVFNTLGKYKIIPVPCEINGTVIRHENANYTFFPNPDYYGGYFKNGKSFWVCDVCGKVSWQHDCGLCGDCEDKWAASEERKKKLAEAYTKAKQARFEHGENGGIG